MWDDIEPLLYKAEELLPVAERSELSDYKHHLIDGSWLCLIQLINDTVISACLLKTYVFENTKVLYIMSMGGNIKDTRDEHMKYFMAIAQQEQCTEIRFDSERKGWGRFLTQQGFEKQPTPYVYFMKGEQK